MSASVTLALDTATPLVSVALHDGERVVVELSSEQPMKHGEHLAPLVSRAMEQAGLQLEVDCPALPAPAYVDRDLWEKIVLNLLSNAFKFTLAGEVVVRLREVDGDFVLTVQDSGVGIPHDMLPRIFDLFTQVARGLAAEMFAP